jgi:MoxR-like ATPase
MFRSHSLAGDRAPADRWAQAAQVAGRARAEVAARASVTDWALDRALARAALLEMASPERAFLEGLAGVAASGGQDEVWSDRYS